MTARLLPGLAMSARAWRVLYRSTDAAGSPIAVSGVILVPNTANPASPRPLLGFAPGTQGLARSAAALSRQLEVGLEYEAWFLAAAVRRGWVVAVTDYPGLGTPGLHPYVVGKTNGRAVLDIMRAARNLPQTGLRADCATGIYGYSEGGNSAGWAAQLEPGYAPDVRLRAVAVGAAPVDFPELVTDLDGGLFSFLLLYAGLGLNSAYPDLRFHDYLNRGGRLAAAVLRRTHILAAIVLGLILPKRRGRYLSADPFVEPDWAAQLRDNSLGYLAPAAPVLVGIGRQDQVIPLPAGTAVVTALDCAGRERAGTSHPVWRTSHGGTAIRQGWIRFPGRAPQQPRNQSAGAGKTGRVNLLPRSTATGIAI